jgi:hypothetical protein
MNITIKISIAILLFLCLLDMPYGYFQIVRIAGLIGFTVLAYNAYENKQKELMIVYIGLALLFQPFIKVALGRQIWNIVDIIVGLFLIVISFIDKQRK